MDNFDEIIKQKIDQFEVPYNDAHWAEMNGKLNAIRAAKIKTAILGIAVAISIIAISSYIIFTPSEKQTIEDNTLITEDITTKTSINNTSETKISTKNKHKKNIKNEIQIETIEEKPLITIKDAINTTINNPENKIEPSNKFLKDKTPEKLLNKANAEFIVYNNKVCLGEEVSFESLENNLPVSYIWNFGDGTISYEKNPKHVYNSSHIYSVSLTLLNRQTGEETTTIQNDVITILSNPNAKFSYTETSISHDNNKLKYPYTILNIDEPNKLNSYTWNFGNEEASTSLTGKTIYKKKGKVYTASLVAKNNNNGCITKSTIKILNKNGLDLFAPSGFTPNNNGGNETFIPKALLGWDVQFEMIIINTSGKTIYKTTNRDEPWNGKINNTGQVLNKGVYFWQVITFDAEKNPHRHHGKIHLVK
ncbi:MAG: PKD domain-containing protein [Flavobacteriales bacterium]|nr:PKD domain-containing protein [Flavobacteriales bacterium]NQX96330.1 PKD domain-containing protein [Flavobacteriales bacterium]